MIAAGLAVAGTAWAKSKWDVSRLSVITDEAANTPEEAIAFAHQYGLKCIEIRNPPGDRREYFQLTEPELRVEAARFKREGLSVSFVNTSLMKFTWPGSEPARMRPETPEVREKRLASEQARWDNRMKDLQSAITCAQIMGCDKVRVFAGTRVAEPKSQFQRTADTIGEMSKLAEKEKIHLLLENEGSLNVATSAELAEVVNMIPSKWVGLNWDPHNAYGREQAYPDGYSLLPKTRMLNVQIKGKGIMPDSKEKEDWKTIFQALDKDGYAGKVGLETHLFDGTMIQAAHISMKEMVRIVNELSK
jgi:L-ribulose-5-phosphate 3-epimerase